MKVIDAIARSVEYRLQLLGIRVWHDSCQLIAKGEGAWSTLGARRGLPVDVPSHIEELKEAAGDPLRLTAYQYANEHPSSDLPDVLMQRKTFLDALREN